MLEQLKKQIIDECFFDGEFNHSALGAKKEICIELEQNTSFLDSSVKMPQRAWHVYHDIYEKVLCAGGHVVKFMSFNKGYRKKCNDRSRCMCWDNVRKLSSERMLSGGAENARLSRATPLSEIGYKIAKTRNENKSVFGKMYYHYDQKKEFESYIQTLNDSEVSIEEVVSLFPWVTDSTIYWFFNRHGVKLKKKRSRVQEKLMVFIDSLEIQFIENNRKIIRPLELDFFFPSKMLAIEVNGLWTHSEIQGGKNKHYHLNKYTTCKESEIKLLSFTDDEINNKFAIVCSMIKSKLGILEKTLYARKCFVLENAKKSDVNQFFEDNHIQGAVPCSFAIALYNEGEIVAAMSFSAPRFSKQYDYELLRFAVKQGYSIPGAFSRLLSRVETGKSVVSYANLNYSSGHVYEKNKFRLEKVSPPNYWYIDPSYTYRKSRIKFQKHKLSELLYTFDPNKTEWQNMQENGYDRIWDCGNQVWVINT